MWLNKKLDPARVTRRPARVIFLKERNFHMLKKDLILRNPLRLIGEESEDILPRGGFGAVLARAGVGKTALMVQLALDSLLRSTNVLHISLTDTVKKIDLWYEEVFKNIARLYNLKKTDQLWDSILPHRFIMTFRIDGFGPEKFEERITELTDQGIFFPEMIIIDGLALDDSIRPTLTDLKNIAAGYAQRIWFAVRTHRHEDNDIDGMPSTWTEVSDLFNVALHLQPQGDEIHIKVLKGLSPNAAAPALFLDPATMLIKDTG